jgi:CheY-like chemotaxis protein
MVDCILVVDDDLAIREFVRQALEGEGYKVRTAVNGAEALEMVAQSTQLILLDMRMPIMDGWGFMQAYCEQESCVPIIAFSANLQRPEQMLCVREFLAKPFDLDKLIYLVAKYVPPQAKNTPIC